jgi:hypothetical protein
MFMVYVSFKDVSYYNNKKFWEELIAYFPLVGHRPHRKRRVQQFLYCMCIRCRGNVFTEPLPSNDTHTDTQTGGRRDL